MDDRDGQTGQAHAEDQELEGFGRTADLQADRAEADPAGRREQGVELAPPPGAEDQQGEGGSNG